MRNTLTKGLAALTVAATLTATATDASAQWRGRGGWRSPGVAAGVIAGAVVAGANDASLNWIVAAREHDWNNQTRRPCGKRVAIAGLGPSHVRAGLLARWSLRRQTVERCSDLHEQGIQNRL